MKGIIVLKPLEYNIETVGERWKQGEVIKGTLKIKNHGGEALEIDFLKVSLCSGNYKKVKAKDKKALEYFASRTIGEKIKIGSLEEKEFSWEFQLSDDCRISDKDGSVFLTFFDKEDVWPTGNIELNIDPKIMIVQFLEIMDNFLRFKIGPKKFSKGLVEVKLTPPGSRELSHVDSLLLKMKVIENSLSLHYTFNLRVLEMAGSAITSSAKVKEYEQVLTAKEFYMYGTSLNQDSIIAAVNSILNQVKPKMML